MTVLIRRSFPRYASQFSTIAHNPVQGTRTRKIKTYGASKAYRAFEKDLRAWIKQGRAVEYVEKGEGWDVQVHVTVLE